MKAVIFIGAMLCWALLSSAQTQLHETDAPLSPSEVKGDVKHHEKGIILFVEPTFNYIINRGYSEFTIGASGGMIINRWLVGIYGEEGELKHKMEGDFTDIKWSMQHAGLRLGYLFPVKHNESEWMVGFQTGWGGMELETPIAEETEYHCNITTYTPEVGYILPVGKITHLQFSVGYQWVSGVNHQYLDSKRLEGPILQFAITIAPHL